ncbi:hypothetical protein [Phytohabitans houttuyneae]|uniref:hypothetical protein n=1 Tax=Phytohabitans houttuyneae TaxID=1076126 RepID=UPI0015647E41|nr:hypothetical protein [Phytohabitans houttuyneae]
MADDQTTPAGDALLAAEATIRAAQIQAQATVAAAKIEARGVQRAARLTSITTLMAACLAAGVYITSDTPGPALQGENPSGRYSTSPSGNGTVINTFDAATQRHNGVYGYPNPDARGDQPIIGYLEGDQVSVSCIEPAGRPYTDSTLHVAASSWAQVRMPGRALGEATAWIPALYLDLPTAAPSC